MTPGTVQPSPTPPTFCGTSPVRIPQHLMGRTVASSSPVSTSCDQTLLRLTDRSSSRARLQTGGSCAIPGLPSSAGTADAGSSTVDTSPPQVLYYHRGLTSACCRRGLPRVPLSLYPLRGRQDPAAEARCVMPQENALAPRTLRGHRESGGRRRAPRPECHTRSAPMQPIASS